MSCKINGTSITLTRGDTLLLKVNILKDGEAYTPEEGDVVRFALKNSKIKADKSDYQDQDPLILKEIPIETMVLELEPSDTKELAFKEYVYDIEITFADGTVDTFITAAKFEITEEVH